jgi:hypothetical protein
VAENANEKGLAAEHKDDSTRPNGAKRATCEGLLWLRTRGVTWQGYSTASQLASTEVNSVAQLAQIRRSFRGGSASVNAAGKSMRCDPRQSCFGGSTRAHITVWKYKLHSPLLHD